MRARWQSLGEFLAGAAAAAVAFVVTQVYTPYFLAVAVPLLIAWFTVLHRRRRLRAIRLAAGQCVCCGYDLTANVSRVCPESGMRKACLRQQYGMKPFARVEPVDGDAPPDVALATAVVPHSVVPYSTEASPPLEYGTKVLLAAGMACAVLHIGLAGVAVARLAAWRGVVTLSGYWAAYYLAEAVLRTVLPALVAAGLVGVWTRRRSAAGWTARVAAAFVALGAAEVVVSLVSFLTGPPRPNDLPGVLLSIGQTFLNRYGPFLLLAYVLIHKRSVRVRE